MSNQIRPGARGGRDQFSWDQVKEDKLRLNYLGSSIHGVPDKYKKGPDTFWYAKEPTNTTLKSKNEIKNVKDKEKQMMESLLGGSGNGGLLKPKLVKAEQVTSKPNIIQRRDYSPDRSSETKMRHREQHINEEYSRDHRAGRSSSNRNERHPSNRFERHSNTRDERDSSSRNGSNRHDSKVASNIHSEVNRCEKDSRYERDLRNRHFEVSRTHEVSSTRYSSEVSGNNDSRESRHRYNESRRSPHSYSRR